MIHAISREQVRYLEKTLERLSGRASRREGDALDLLREALTDASENGEASIEVIE